MDEDIPIPFIKKRNKLRPSGSSSSLRADNSTEQRAAASPSSLSFAQDEGDDDEGNVAVIRKPKKKTPAGVVRSREGASGGVKSRLSFGADQDDEDSPTVIKRSTNASDSPRRLLRAPNAQPPTSLDQANISTPAQSSSSTAPSIYSNEYFNQLKATQRSAPPPPAPPASNGSHANDYDALTRSKFGDQIDDIPSEIPTSAKIAEAKERRERMRREGGGTGSDGFISLEVGHVTKRGESRLVREDDELGDGDEDLAAYTESKDTLPLGQKANKAAADRMRSGMVEMIQDVEDDQMADDQEQREWEEAQIRRGEQRKLVSQSESGKAAYRPTPIPSASTLPSIASVTSRLEEALREAKANHAMDSAALNHFSKEREELDAQEKELREEVGKAEEKRRWFGDFKAYIEEVADFLDQKYPALEKIERENVAIQKERAQIIARRRYVDDADDVALFTGSAVPTSYPLPEAGATEMLDPDVSSALAPRSEERSVRRVDRLSRAASEEGAGTDDELENDQQADLSAAVSGLREDLARLFADVKADEYRDPNLGIRKKFEEWRDQFGDEYQNAFGGLAMVGVWEFWARVEMGLWNPFEVNLLARSPPGLDAYQWHASLSSYGHPSEDVPDAEDESEAVVNLLVTSVVIPRLEKLAATWDPLSRAQTTRAVGVVDEVSYCVERSSPRFEALVQAFMRRIQLAITQAQSLLAPRLEQLKMPAIAMDPSTFEARNRFARRQVRLLQNALRWRRYAKSLRLQSQLGENGEEELVGAGALFDEVIVRELVAKVILPVVEAGWQTGGNEIAARVLELLPKDVAPPALVRRLEGERV